MRWGVFYFLAVMVVAGCGPSTVTSEIDLAVAILPDLSTPTTVGDLGEIDAAETDLGVSPVAWRRQVIYLALVDRFFNGSATNDASGLPGCLDVADPQKFHGGDFAGMTQKLPYLAELGATALWITPPNLQATGPVGTGRCGYHGYWTDFTEPDDGAIEPRLGTADELNLLVDALHARGMRFILDMVVNHAGDGARLPAQKPAWFHDPATCSSLGDPAVYCPYRAGVHDFAQENAEAAAYLDGFAAGWAQRLALDGIRMDTAKYVPVSYFRDHWAPAVRAVRPLLIAEVFSESVAELQPYLDGGFDTAFNFPLRRALIDAFAKGGSVDAVATVIADEQQRFGARALDLVNLLDNHDTGRFASEPGNLAADELQKRLRLGLIALFALPGIPQLYTGDELGILGGNDPDNRRDMPSWAWADADRAGTHTGALPDAQGTFALVKRLTQLRLSDALSDGGYTELWRQNGGANPNLYVFLRGSSVLAVFNNGAATASQAVPVVPIAEGTIVDDRALAGAPTSLAISGGKLRFSLPARTAGLYEPRDPQDGSAVTFTVQAPMGMPIAVVGSTPELGQWDPARAIQMSSVCNGGSCTWSVTVRVLTFGQSMELKFVRLAGTPMWEAGANRSFTVPAMPTSTYDGGNFQ